MVGVGGLGRGIFEGDAEAQRWGAKGNGGTEEGTEEMALKRLTVLRGARTAVVVRRSRVMVAVALRSRRRSASHYKSPINQILSLSKTASVPYALNFDCS